MANYTDLYSQLWQNDDMRNRVAVALVVSAIKVMDDSANFPTTTVDAAVIADRENFALDIVRSTRGWAEYAWKLLIADNRSATVAQILNATDATIQAKVDGLVDVLAKAHAASQAAGG